MQRIKKINIKNNLKTINKCYVCRNANVNVIHIKPNKNLNYNSYNLIKLNFNIVIYWICIISQFKLKKTH